MLHSAIKETTPEYLTKSVIINILQQITSCSCCLFCPACAAARASTYNNNQNSDVSNTRQTQTCANTLAHAHTATTQATCHQNHVSQCANSQSHSGLGHHLHAHQTTQQCTPAAARNNIAARTNRIHVFQNVVTNHPHTRKASAGSLRVKLHSQVTQTHAHNKPNTGCVW